MWRPPERIRHRLPQSSVPSRAEAARALLFQPLTLASGLRLADRTWVPAMVPWRATEEGFVTPAILDWYRRFARGEPAVLVVEATGIRDVPSGPLLRIGHDRFVPGLGTLAGAIREASGGRTRPFIQVIDFLRIRRRPPRERFLRELLAIREGHRRALADVVGDARLREASDTETRERLVALDDDALGRVLDRREAEALWWGERERVTDVHLPHVRDLPLRLPGLFADAAARARDAGFDGVELHFAHAYTMASFLSRLNTREDGWGGTLEGRIRLPIEVLRAVRARVGASFTVGCRLLCDEIVEGGSRVDDAAWFGARLARAGLDYLSLSTGGKFEDAERPRVGEAAYPYTGRSGYECMPTTISDALGPFARHLPEQRAVRAAVRAAGCETPVVAAGGIGTFEAAEGILRRGDADLIAAARQTLADPDWWKKLRTGRGHEIRRCEYTNYCEALDQRHRPVTCKLWDRLGLAEPAVATVDGGARRLVAPEWKP